MRSRRTPKCSNYIWVVAVAERAPANLLEIKSLNVFYGRSHALQGVDLTLAHGVLSLVGRNGMGKTTLCRTIVRLMPAASGSIRFMGEDLIGKTPAEIARLGLGYVPQGRRLWPSVTVDEHLRLAGGNGRGQWTIGTAATWSSLIVAASRQGRSHPWEGRSAAIGGRIRLSRLLPSGPSQSRFVSGRTGNRSMQ